jgi:hypothetical protein
MDPRLEIRYVVIKLKHMSADEQIELDDFLAVHNIPTVDCVVVEEDWPEYKPTIDAIMKRVNNES